MLVVAGVMAPLLLLAPASFAASTHDFGLETTVINQCTGEPATISLRGKIIVRQKAEGETFVYTVQSQLNGSATVEEFGSEESGTQYVLVGNEQAEFEREAPAAELVLFNNARVLGKGGESTYVGYDEQTITVDADGEIENVTHRFDFACD